MSALSILSKLDHGLSLEEIIAAMRIETAIINHCRANLNGFMDAERAELLAHVETEAEARLSVLREIME